MSRIAKLPAGYRQVEYIESSGTQYCDTGFKPNQDSSIIMDVAFNTTGTQGAYGARSTSSSKAFELIWMTNGYYRFYYNNGYSNFTDGITDPTVRHTIKHEKNVLTIGDATLSRTYAEFQCTHNLVLFAHNSAGEIAHPASAKIYSCLIYDDGTLVRDYIPCINPSGAAGLYDLVYGVFYGNAGTGVFAVGRNVYSEEEITKLEYVESNGTQYIDTEFKPNQDTRVVMVAKFLTKPTTNKAIFGARNASAERFYWCYRGGSSDYSVAYGASASNNTFGGADPTARHTYDFNKNVANIGDASVAITASTFTSAYNLYLFAFNNAGSLQYPSALVGYSCQIYDNGVLARDYCPAVIGEEVGLWDACSGFLYTSASDTELIAGPEKQTGPARPSDLKILEHTDASVTLVWSEVTNALGYRVYKNGSLYSEQTDTTFADGVTLYQNVEYGVSAYNDEGESKTAVLTVYTAPENPVPYLITDRTQSDTDRVIALAKIGYENMAVTEQEEWNSQLKGAYNSSDLNRVESAVDYLAKALRVLPVELREYAASLDVAWDKYFDVPYEPNAYEVSTKQDWTMKDIPTPADMDRYLANVIKLRNALQFASDALPQTMNDLRWQGANAVESALKNLDAAITLLSGNKQMLIENTAAAWVYSGETFMGEV